jgi:hypothetical protein
VTENQTQQLTATVQGDLKNQGVTWSLINPATNAVTTSCGSISPTSSASGAAVVYTAPTTTCSVAAVATSVTDTTKSASVTLNVVAPVISVAWNGTQPSNMDATNLEGNSTVNFAVTITNDLQSQGVTWSSSNANCGSGVASGSGNVSYAFTAASSSSLTANCVTTIKAASVTDTTKYISTSFTVYPISVSINPGGTQSFVPGAAGASYTATVNNDALGAPGTGGYGVTWSLNPSTGCGSLSNNTITSVTYTPPSSGSCSTQLIATSIADTSKSNYDNITVAPATTLTVTTSYIDVPQGMVGMPYTQNIYSVNCPGQTSCSTISGGTSPYSLSYTGLPSWASYDQNGNIYGTPTGSATVTTAMLTVKDGANNTKTGSITIPVIAATGTTNNGLLNGHYACVVHGISDTGYTSLANKTLYLNGLAFAFGASGGGAVGGGEADMNGSGGYTFQSSLTGSYAVGSDNRGYLMIGPSSSQEVLFAIAAGALDSSGKYEQFRLTAMGDAGSSPEGGHGGGICYRQYNSDGSAVTSSDNTLSGQTISGGYVFALNGEDGDGVFENEVGSVNFSTNTGYLDSVDGSSVNTGMEFYVYNTPIVDSWGRYTITAGPSSTESNQSAVYITNQTYGKGVMVSINAHNAASHPDLWWGQLRQQNATDIAANQPITGNAVVYLSGVDSSGGNYKALAAQATGSTSGAASSGTTSLTINAQINNNDGVITPNGNPVGTTLYYKTDATSGRTTLNSQSGAIFYLYDTNMAVVLFDDTGNGGTSPENMLGWMEKQTAPSSGTWASSYMGTSYFMGKTYNGDTNGDSNTGTLTISSTGSFTAMAQDDGGNSWADWGEGFGGEYGLTGAGVFVPDTSVDPSAAYGVFDVKFTPTGSSQEIVSYCFAISVDKATTSTTKGRAACIDADSSHPAISIVEE